MITLAAPTSGAGCCSRPEIERVTLIRSQRFVDSRRDQQERGAPGIPATSRAALERLQTGTPATEWTALRKELGFRQRELVLLAGSPARRRFPRLRRGPEAEPPLGSLDDLRQVAIYMIGTGAVRPRSVASWFRSRHLALAWQRPIDILRSGDSAAVRRAAESTCGARLVAVP